MTRNIPVMDLAAFRFEDAKAVTERPKTFGEKLRVVANDGVNRVLGRFTPPDDPDPYVWFSVEEMVDRMRL